MSIQIVTISVDELKEIISYTIRIELAKMEGRLHTGDDIGRIVDLAEAAKITSLSKSRIRTLASKRLTDEGIPCVLGRNSQLTFSTVALNLWEMGKSCQELTEWMEERKNMPLI
ncbi:MAG: hypothetical protein R2824_06110 [Saprospiraceae bacterium]|nr:hypothetical protein [Lewinella sp.]